MLFCLLNSLTIELFCIFIFFCLFDDDDDDDDVRTKQHSTEQMTIYFYIYRIYIEKIRAKFNSIEQRQRQRQKQRQHDYVDGISKCCWLIIHLYIQYISYLIFFNTHKHTQIQLDWQSDQSFSFLFLFVICFNLI